MINNKNSPLRQGDVILIPKTENIQGRKQSDLVLAYGEVTGHKHQIIEGQAELYDRDGTLYLKVLSPTALLSHEEHKTIAIPQGNWEVKIQREYNPSQKKYFVKD